MRYRIFDGHADTMTKLYENKGSIRKNDYHIDFERIKIFEGYTQVFAAFVDQKAIKDPMKTYVKNVIEKYKDEIESCGISPVKTIDELKNEQYSSILSIEGGEAIEGDVDNLFEFYELGVRLMTLTWNYKNEICDGIGEKDGNGLTPFGKRVIKEMNKLGMVVDVSHISEKGFWDVLKASEKPFVASHSNVKSICNHPRNLTDAQIKAVIENGGVIGINFYPMFLEDSGKCDLKKILEHIEYILYLGGENNIGLGSDFDGIEYLPDGMTGVESVSKLISLMEEREYGKELINKILFDNFFRVLEAVFA
ncbi:MAG: dipeptidase [Clostridia bacterium]|nr:dipeptidase [Clostridia bacterium]